MDASIVFDNITHYSNWSYFEISMRCESPSVNKELREITADIYGANAPVTKYLNSGQTSDTVILDIEGNATDFAIRTNWNKNYAQTRIKYDIANLNFDHFMLIDDFMAKPMFMDVAVGRVGAEPSAPAVINHIIANELFDNDDTWTDAGAPSFDEADYANWVYQFTIADKVNSKKVIEDIASVSPYIPRFNSMGAFQFDVIPSGGGTSIRTIKENEVISFSFKRTPVEKVYTAIEFHYDWDYAREEFAGNTGEITVDDLGCLDTSTDDYDFSYYGLNSSHSDSKLVISDDRGKYIKDDTTAIAFAEWFLGWHCNQHIIMKVKLPLQYLALEIGDKINFNSILGGVKPYGIDYTVSGATLPGNQAHHANFMITSTKKDLQWVQIEAVQLHDISTSYRGYGCTDSRACNYDENATVENGSCEYQEVSYRDCNGDCLPPPDGLGPDPDHEGWCLEDRYCTDEGVDPPDCAGVCGGTSVMDDCGYCVEPQFHNNAQDDCGVCNGNCFNEVIPADMPGGPSNPCSGCNELDAINYDPNVCEGANYSDNSCAYIELISDYCPFTETVGGNTINHICDIAPWRCCYYDEEQTGYWSSVDVDGNVIPCPNGAFQAPMYTALNSDDGDIQRLGWWTKSEFDDATGTGGDGVPSMPSFEEYCNNCVYPVGHVYENLGCCEVPYVSEQVTPYAPIVLNETNCENASGATTIDIETIRLICIEEGVEFNPNFEVDAFGEYAGSLDGNVLFHKIIYSKYNSEYNPPNCWLWSNLANFINYIENEHMMQVFIKIDAKFNPADTEGAIDIIFDHQLMGVSENGGCGVSYEDQYGSYLDYSDFTYNFENNMTLRPEDAHYLFNFQNVSGSSATWYTKLDFNQGQDYSQFLGYILNEMNTGLAPYNLYDYITTSDDPCVNSLYWKMPIRLYKSHGANVWEKFFELDGTPQNDVNETPDLSNEFQISHECPEDEEFIQYQGDMNSDGSFNVLDILALANCVLTATCNEYGNIADMNGDSSYNILDILELANCVLTATCGPE